MQVHVMEIILWLSPPPKIYIYIIEKKNHQFLFFFFLSFFIIINWLVNIYVFITYIIEKEIPIDWKPPDFFFFLFFACICLEMNESSFSEVDKSLSSCVIIDFFFFPSQKFSMIDIVILRLKCHDNLSMILN